MWLDDLSPDATWSSLWHGYIRCDCSGIRTFTDPCPACGTSLGDVVEQTMVLDDGREITTSQMFAGAEERYEDYVYLQLMKREWERVERDSELQHGVPHTENVSAGASLVLLFWTYFETRIERLLRDGLRSIPPRFLKDALKRHSSISARLKDFYKIAFDSTYHDDLIKLEYADVSHHLKEVHRRRNAFVHGDPHSIDDSLATAVVAMLKQDHEAWIAVYNLRVAVR